MINHVIEAKSGTYLLVMHAARHQQLEIGRLGVMQVVLGYYLYVDSAFGSGGVKARVLHHMRVSERSRWHIDYLRQVCPLVMVWCRYDEVHGEHEWVAQLETMQRSHSETKPSFAAFSHRVGKQKGEHRNIPLFQILCQASSCLIEI